MTAKACGRWRCCTLSTDQTFCVHVQSTHSLDELNKKLKIVEELLRMLEAIRPIFRDKDFDKFVSEGIQPILSSLQRYGSSNATEKTRLLTRKGRRGGAYAKKRNSATKLKRQDSMVTSFATLPSPRSEPMSPAPISSQGQGQAAAPQVEIFDEYLLLEKLLPCGCICLVSCCMNKEPIVQAWLHLVGEVEDLQERYAIMRRTDQ